MNTLQETINLRLQLQQIFRKASKETMRNASKVKVEIAFFDPETKMLKGMLHTAISGKEIYQSRIELSEDGSWDTTHCTCIAGQKQKTCKHVIRLAHWLDERLEFDQRAMEQIIAGTLLGSYEIRKALKNQNKRSA